MNNLLFIGLIVVLLYYFFYYLPSQKKNISPKPTTSNKGTQTEELATENIVNFPGPRYIQSEPAALKKPNSKDN